MNGGKKRTLALAYQRLPGLFVQSAHITQSQAKRPRVGGSRRGFECARPLGSQDIDGQRFESVPLRIFYDGRGTVKTHGLVVQQSRGKRRQIMAFEISAGIGE